MKPVGNRYETKALFKTNRSAGPHALQDIFRRCLSIPQWFPNRFCGYHMFLHGFHMFTPQCSQCCPNEFLVPPCISNGFSGFIDSLGFAINFMDSRTLAIDLQIISVSSPNHIYLFSESVPSFFDLLRFFGSGLGSRQTLNVSFEKLLSLPIRTSALDAKQCLEHDVWISNGFHRLSNSFHTPLFYIDRQIVFQRFPSGCFASQ